MSTAEADDSKAYDIQKVGHLPGCDAQLSSVNQGIASQPFGGIHGCLVAVDSHEER
jgi:hypothetical protein